MIISSKVYDDYIQKFIVTIFPRPQYFSSSFEGYYRGRSQKNLKIETYKLNQLILKLFISKEIEFHTR